MRIGEPIREALAVHSALSAIGFRVQLEPPMDAYCKRIDNKTPKRKDEVIRGTGDCAMYKLSQSGGLPRYRRHSEASF